MLYYIRPSGYGLFNVDEFKDRRRNGPRNNDIQKAEVDNYESHIYEGDKWLSKIYNSHQGTYRLTHFGDITLIERNITHHSTEIVKATVYAFGNVYSFEVYYQHIANMNPEEKIDYIIEQSMPKRRRRKVA